MYINSVETKEDKEFKEMKQVVDKLSRNYDDRTDEEKSLAMNFWIPQNTPEFKDRMKMVFLLFQLNSSRRKKLRVLEEVMRCHERS